MKTTLHMLATLVVAGTLAGGSLSLVNGWADPLIQANQARARDEAIGFLVPGGTPEQVVDQAGLTAWRVTADGATSGWVLRCSGAGFQDKIDLMIALDPGREEIRGLKVLGDSETPGLGTWIRLSAEHEQALAAAADRNLGAAADDAKNFPLQFFGWGDGRRLSAAGDLVVVKGKKRSALGETEVQAITAATISSKAVVQIVNDAVTRLNAVLAEPGGAS
ncbi:MAG TPA: FMN-binding protein [Candidatus Krumholzibacteria bacterium]|nr:FMN-binding protein [Candidatus Krumholzibacteria bacterium]HPD70511.1 FMN-binding protein [Candidatus Krumholzibacteria bacterium]HRY39789.1 FMN-binding protein [Candidatus Krumholzibacteria bacterium]